MRGGDIQKVITKRKRRDLGKNEGEEEARGETTKEDEEKEIMIR